MPKNDKKHKNAKNKPTHDKRQLVLKTESQEYAKVTKMLGNCRIEVECYDNKVRLGEIRRRMRRGRQNRINQGDIVLVALRDFQDDKCDVIHLYNHEEVNRLKKMYEIPDDTSYNDGMDTFDFIHEDEETEKMDDAFISGI